MKILKIVPQGKGYDVYMEGTDMVAHVHLPNEVAELEKQLKKEKVTKKEK